jgi:hypothetical protein
LSSQANVRLDFTQSAPGRRASGRCVAPTRTNRRRPPCHHSVSRGVLTLTGHGGVNKVSFQGRLSSTRTLAPGRYTVLISASNAGGRSRASSLSFRIVK